MFEQIMRRFTLPALAGVVAAAVFAGAAAAQEGPEGDWEGELSAQGQTIAIIFHITADEEGALDATLDSPDQGAFGIGTSAVTFEEGVLTIEVADIGGEYTGTLSEDGSTLEGTWSQGGMSLDLVLTRVETDG